MTFSWTQPFCEDCWNALHPDRTPYGLADADEETCCHCGKSTNSGIYVRVDPLRVPYPTLEK